MQIASANQEQQEMEIKPIKKHILKTQKVKIFRENLLLKHIFNECFEG